MIEQVPGELALEKRSERAAAAQGATEPSNSELLDKLRDIESKLKEIHPGNSPSFEDLQNQLPPKSE